MPRHSHHDHDDEIRSEVADITKKWLRDHGGSLVKKAVQQYNTELLNDIEIASAVQREEVWEAIKKLRQLVDEKPREQQLPKGPSVRSLSDTVLEEVSTCTKLIGDLEQRLAGAERVLRRTEEAAESCLLAVQKHDEDVRNWAERVTELQNHRDQTQTAWLRHLEEQETMRQVISNDFVLLGSGGVRTKEDLRSYVWSKGGCDSRVSKEKGVFSADLSKAVSTENSSEPDIPEQIMTADTDESQTTERKMDAICSSDDSYELQLSVWDAVLFLGVKGFRWHEQLLLGVGFVINVIMQSVFCLMVLHLGTDRRVLDDTAIPDLEAWLERADPWEVRGVCGTVGIHSLSTSYSQMMLMEEARGYFEETLLGFSWGPLLTIMVIALWSGTMVSHGRSLFDLTVALWELTDWRWRSARTQFAVTLKNIGMTTMTPPRFLWMIFAVVLQTAVIVILLVFGCLWMAKSSSVIELLLNAVALAFITETDELVFITIVPTTVKNLVKKMEPLPLKPPRSSLPPLRSVVSLSTIVGCVTFFWVYPVAETSRRLSEVRLALCDQ